MSLSVEIFLIGVQAALGLVVSLFFLKFWRKTRDWLFLAFAASFFIRGLNDATRVGMSHPSEATLWSFLVGLASSLLIVLAIIWKNVEQKDR